ncbi:MAG: hypothetical protein PHD46_06855 [Eubacteriales bacterium]|nr:hypothetical protein [Eubacteriales bacterium]HBR31021.1 hypothetical protein [Clostridiales bacterium]
MSYQTLSIREHPEYLDRAVDYFSSKWGIDHIGYYEKYGWRFHGLEDSEWGDKSRVYEIKSCD